MTSPDKSPSSPAGKAEFYQGHLDKVSRSFAFCIPRLESPLREQVALGYLVCRILDTVEDASWSDFAKQREAFESFDRFISEPARADEIGEWAKGFPQDIPDSEKSLLADSALIFADFHAQPKAAREAMLGPVLSMSAGMRHYMGRKHQVGALKLKTVADVNRYCFFVAGVVGEMLTRLLQAQAEKAKIALHPPSWREAYDFGLFLQKVNLLKDQLGDEALGRFLVPSRERVRESLLDNANGAFRYLLAIPRQLPGFRLFCAWSLFLGLASLPFIERAYLEAANIKIPRDETAFLLASIEKVISDDSALEELFTAFKPEGLTAAREADATVEPEDRVLLGLYQGVLSPEAALSVFHAT